MFIYEICSLDGSGHVCRSQALICRSDLVALQVARKEPGSHEIEIWQGPRLVARIKRDDRPVAWPN